MKAVIDRIEGDMIVFESETGIQFDIPFDYFPDAKEGDHVIITITKDEGSKKEAEERIQDLRSQLKRVNIGD